MTPKSWQLPYEASGCGVVVNCSGDRVAVWGVHVGVVDLQWTSLDHRGERDCLVLEGRNCSPSRKHRPCQGSPKSLNSE